MKNAPSEDLGLGGVVVPSWLAWLIPPRRTKRCRSRQLRVRDADTVLVRCEFDRGHNHSRHGNGSRRWG